MEAFMQMMKQKQKAAARSIVRSFLEMAMSRISEFGKRRRKWRVKGLTATAACDGDGERKKKRKTRVEMENLLLPFLCREGESVKTVLCVQTNLIPITINLKPTHHIF